MTGVAELDTRCTFQSITRVDDGGGGFTTAWQDQFSCWGSFVFPLVRARVNIRMEAVAAGGSAVEARTTGELVVRRYRETTALIDERWRVTAKGRTWNIGKPIPDQGDGWVRMPVESGVPT